jgi:uncharacterized protein (TIGR00251 family)
MSNPDSWYQWDEEDLLLNIRVQPKASHDEIVGPHNNALKIRITAPPVDGKANAHLVRFLAKSFGVAKSRIKLISGETGRDKKLRIRAPTNLLPGISR